MLFKALMGPCERRGLVEGVGAAPPIFFAKGVKQQFDLLGGKRSRKKRKHPPNPRTVELNSWRGRDLGNSEEPLI